LSLSFTAVVMEGERGDEFGEAEGVVQDGILGKTGTPDAGGVVWPPLDGLLDAAVVLPLDFGPVEPGRDGVVATADGGFARAGEGTEGVVEGGGIEEVFGGEELGLGDAIGRGVGNVCDDCGERQRQRASFFPYF